MENIQDRIQVANRVISIISKYGRRLLFSHRNGQVASFRISNGHLYFNDQQSGVRIDMALMPHEWDSFTSTQEMRELVDALAGYIRTGSKVSIKHFGPWPRHMNGGDPWGYGPTMKHVRKEIIELDILAETMSISVDMPPPAPDPESAGTVWMI